MTNETKKYYLFVDESGDHGLVTLDPAFPVFLLYGLLMSQENYSTTKDNINKLKNNFWKNKDVILHSRDIRKCNKEFQILFDDALKQQFYLQ